MKLTHFEAGNDRPVFLIAVGAVILLGGRRSPEDE